MTRLWQSRDAYTAREDINSNPGPEALGALSSHTFFVGFLVADGKI